MRKPTMANAAAAAREMSRTSLVAMEGEGVLVLLVEVVEGKVVAAKAVVVEGALVPAVLVVQETLI